MLGQSKERLTFLIYFKVVRILNEKEGR